MSSSGLLVLASCTFILLIIGMNALGDVRSSVNDSNPVLKSDADMGTSAATPLLLF
jgi:hypothetical protein